MQKKVEGKNTDYIVDNKRITRKHYLGAASAGVPSSF